MVVPRERKKERGERDEKINLGLSRETKVGTET